MKKIILQLLTIIICFTGILPVIAESDTQGPEVHSLTIDKHDVSLGDTITIIMEATDEHEIKISSGTPCLTFVGPGDSNYINVYFKYLEEGKYRGTITVYESTRNGEYNFSALTIQDELGNRKTYYPNDLDVSNLYFNVTGVQSPVNESRYFGTNKKSYSQYEPILININVDEIINSGYNINNTWVAMYPQGEKPHQNMAIRWHWVNTIITNSNYDMLTVNWTSGEGGSGVSNNRDAYLTQAGELELYLLADESYDQIIDHITIKLTDETIPASDIRFNINGSSQYIGYRYEHPYPISELNFSVSSEMPYGAWVGICDGEFGIGDDFTFASYNHVWLVRDINNQMIDLSSECVTAGTYTLVVFGTPGYDDIRHLIYIDVINDVIIEDIIKQPTCTEDGYSLVMYSDGSTETVIIPAFGHNWGSWVFNGEESKTHTRMCLNDSNHNETESCSFDQGVVNGNVTTYTCQICGGKYTVKSEKSIVTVDGMIRIAGSNRFETSKTIATTYRRNYGRSSVANIVLANGDNFADALAGSYLAAVKEAPIIITRKGKESDINSYIKSIIRDDGTIYVLGGTNAIPESCLSELSGYKIKRLGGANRYETNILILEEAGIDSDTILIATGNNYADSLSASSTGLPMLLVKDSLDSKQKSFLNDNKGKDFYILGGTNAVNSNIEQQLKKYGNVTRLAGNTRFETSIKIAKEFYDNPDAVVLAYSNDFPDGLCGGPLAYQVDAPLILTKPGSESAARSYVTSKGITNGYILGGSRRLTENCVNIVFGIEDPYTPPEHQYTYIGNKNSKVCHRDTCPVLINMKESNKVYFSSIEEAKRRGYRACHDCKPWPY